MRISNLKFIHDGNRARVMANVQWEDCDRPDQNIYIETEEAFAKECFVSKRHNQNNQWGFLKEQKSSRLRFDPVLEFILGMETLSREEFKNGIADYLHTN